MLAENSANFSVFYRYAKQRGKVISALAQTHVKTAISFILNYKVTAAKGFGAGFFKVTAPEIGLDVSRHKKLNYFAITAKTKTVRKHLVGRKKKNYGFDF